MRNHASLMAGFICLLAITGFTRNASSQNISDQQNPAVQTTTKGTCLDQFLLPDGRIDFEALRASGYQGPLDLKGLNVQVDPATHEPITCLSASNSPHDNPDDVYWDNSISPSFPGIDGAVYALTVYNEKLIVGGQFAVAGGVVAHNIAAWDGASWSALGSGVDSVVYALTTFDGQLVVGGRFLTAGHVAANHLASWDGLSWNALGEGTDNTVISLSSYDGDLIAGGYFTAAGDVAANWIASWNGSSWSALGSGLSFGPVRTMTTYQNKLFAAAAEKVFAWDGSAWIALGSGFSSGGLGGFGPGVIRSLIVYNGELIAGGEFNRADTVQTGPMALWNGTSWTTVFGSEMDGVVSSMTVQDGEAIVGGYLSDSLGVYGIRLFAWDGSSWSMLGPGMVGGSNPYVSALAFYGSTLVVAGSFTSVGDINANNVAAWDGLSWFALETGLNGPVWCLTVYDDMLIAGGNFTKIGNVAACRIAAWNGDSWYPLGSGMDDIVFALTVYDDKLIAGGKFRTAGGISANDVAAWDGVSWTTLGSGVAPIPCGGFPPQTCDQVAALTVFDGKLIIAGRFSGVGGVSANQIAAWDGTIWSAIGSGLGEIGIPCDYSVRALTVYNNQLIAGGGFLTAGGVGARHIAAWNGATWSALGSGMIGYSFDTEPEGCGYFGAVNALIVRNNCLVAGGVFLTAGDDTANGIATWNGTAWTPLSSGMSMSYSFAQVNALIVYRGTLFAAGNFDKAGGSPASRIAAWGDNCWISLGSGLKGNYYYYSAQALAEYHDMLQVGGDFVTAGDKVAPNLAQWTKRPGFCGDTDGSYTIDISDVVHLIEYLFSAGSAPQPMSAGDANCDQSVNIADAVYLINYIFAGGPIPCAECE